MPLRTAEQQYEPGEVGAPVDPSALMVELRRIAAAIPPPFEGGVLRGGFQASISTAVEPLVDWYEGFTSAGYRGEVDPVLGIIKVAGGGLYRVEVLIAGTYAGSTQNEAVRLFLDVGTLLPVQSFVIATNKISDLSFAFSGLVPITAGQAVSLSWQGTTALGAFDPVVSSFELSRVR